MATTLLEAEHELALAASGTQLGNPAHRLRLRAGRARDAADPALGLAARSGARASRRAGASLRSAVAAGRSRRGARRRGDRRTARRATGSRSTLRDDGVLEVPHEAVTDPVAYTRGLAATRPRAAARRCAPGARVEAIEASRGGLSVTTADGERLACAVAVNCAGLRADEVARLAGDESFRDLPAQGRVLRLRAAGRRAARTDPAAGAERAQQGRARLSRPWTAG